MLAAVPVAAAMPLLAASYLVDSILLMLLCLCAAALALRRRQSRGSTAANHTSSTWRIASLFNGVASVMRHSHNRAAPKRQAVPRGRLRPLRPASVRARALAAVFAQQRSCCFLSRLQQQKQQQQKRLHRA